MRQPPRGLPPNLLPAASWRAIMNGLDKHFGTDASVDPTMLVQIRDFLDANAGREPRSAPRAPVLRITDTGWFQREHAKIAIEGSSNPNVKGLADCSACHGGAANGDLASARFVSHTDWRKRMEHTKVLVWDLPVRLFHWLLAVSFA